jgi:hypothetical protein
MLHRDRADTGLLGEISLGGELTVIRIDVIDNVIPKLTVKLEVNGSVFLVYDIFHLAI